MDQKWLDRWNEMKGQTAPQADIASYFTEKEIAGIPMDRIDLGLVSIPTGKIMVADPLMYLSKVMKPYIQEVPVGEHPMTVAVACSEEYGNRYAAVKVEFSENKAIRFEEMMMGTEDVENIQQGDYFGFNVDAGLATLIDESVVKSFLKFENNWKNTEEGENIYDDYFAQLFAESYEKNPKNQRKDGDWINWTIPETAYHLPIFATGFGDGVYPVYIGYDEKGVAACVIIQFIDIQLAFG